MRHTYLNVSHSSAGVSNSAIAGQPHYYMSPSLLHLSTIPGKGRKGDTLTLNRN